MGEVKSIIDNLLNLTKDYGTFLIICFGSFQLWKNLRWNRRIYAKNAVEKIDNNIDVKKLNEFALNKQDNEFETFSIKEFNALSEEDQAHIKEALNLYEGLAAGIKMGLYDSKVIKNERGSTFVRVYKAMVPIIIYRREKSPDKKTFIDFEIIAKKWENDKWWKIWQ